MKKKVYNKPMLMTEAFVPQEYVAACYQLACTVRGADPYNKLLQHTTSEGNCGHPEAQIISTNSDGVVTDIYEWHKNSETGKMERLNIYQTNPAIIGAKLEDLAKNGITITWKTDIIYSGRTYTYSHTGKVKEVLANRPLHS